MKTYPMQVHRPWLTLCLPDNDECSLQTHTCWNDSVCVNLPGGYDCVCTSGPGCGGDCPHEEGIRRNGEDWKPSFDRCAICSCKVQKMNTHIKITTLIITMIWNSIFLLWLLKLLIYVDQWSFFLIIFLFLLRCKVQMFNCHLSNLQSVLDTQKTDFGWSITYQSSKNQSSKDQPVPRKRKVEKDRSFLSILFWALTQARTNTWYARYLFEKLHKAPVGAASSSLGQSRSKTPL